MLWGRKEASLVTLSGAPLCFSLVQPHWEPEGKEVTDTFLRLNLLLLVRSKVKGKTVSRSGGANRKVILFWSYRKLCEGRFSWGMASQKQVAE